MVSFRSYNITRAELTISPLAAMAESSSKSRKQPGTSDQEIGHVAKKVKRFRMQSKSFYLTFPQCGAVTKEQAFERIVGKFGDSVEWLVVGAEKHVSGDPHLHVALQCKETQNIGKEDYFDFVCGKHGNYQVMKNKSKCVAYCVKDGDFLERGIDARKLAKGKAKVYEEIGKRCLEGASFDDLCSEGFLSACVQNKKKIEDFIAYATVRRMRTLLSPWTTVRTSSVEAMGIASWLNQSVKRPFPFRSKQLYIHGPPQIGKTTMILELIKRLSIYDIPREEDFYDEYRDGAYDLAVLDEFTGKKSIQWMNQWLDGSRTTLRKKGSQVVKTQNLPTIVLSNRSLMENYPKQAEKNSIFLQALRTRFLEISLNRPFTISFEDEVTRVESMGLEDHRTAASSSGMVRAGHDVSSQPEASGSGMAGLGMDPVTHDENVSR